MLRSFPRTVILSAAKDLHLLVLNDILQMLRSFPRTVILSAAKDLHLLVLNDILQTLRFAQHDR